MLNTIDAGPNTPDIINVIIEIPAHSEPVKYEIDKKSGALFVDRFMTAAMHYPCDYGYVPRTLSEDGDPLDVLVISPLPLLNGSVIQARPIGYLDMTDEAGKDTKILAVPIDKLTPLYKDVHKPSDLPAITLDRIAHFFEHYKDLEKGKWVKINGWEGPEKAKAEIIAAINRF